MQPTRLTPSGSRTCIIIIDSYEDRIPCGVLRNPNLKEDVAFRSLAELVFSMESLFDDIGSPQRTMKPRGEIRIPERRAATEKKSRALATFTVEVMFRQNASWQGKLTWNEKREETSFRSLLELMTIMDAALLPQTAIA